MIDPTDQIAERYESLISASKVCFTIPNDAASNWLPEGYQLVTDPLHILSVDDALMHVLGGGWRLVGDVNGGSRVGLKAEEAGTDIRYVAMRVPITN